jgi:hypothetical protein
MRRSSSGIEIAGAPQNNEMQEELTKPAQAMELRSSTQCSASERPELE